MKFFKGKPKTCSVCGAENPTIHNRPFHFCQACWDSTMNKVRPKVLAQLDNAKRTGKKIELNDAKNITKELTKEITSTDLPR